MLIKNLQGNLRAIAQVIGAENAIKLSRAFGGDELYIPKLDIREIRNQRIYEERKNGKKVRSIAVKEGLSTRQVMAIIKNMKDAERENISNESHDRKREDFVSRKEE